MILVEVIHAFFHEWNKICESFLFLVQNLNFDNLIIYLEKCKICISGLIMQDVIKDIDTI